MPFVQEIKFNIMLDLLNLKTLSGISVDMRRYF